jgi:hypothetical protein
MKIELPSNGNAAADLTQRKCIEQLGLEQGTEHEHARRSPARES